MPDRKGMLSSSTSRIVEVCGNPWNGGCDSSDIALYIYCDGRLIPICRGCWSEICRMGITWNSGVEA